MRILFFGFCCSISPKGIEDCCSLCGVLGFTVGFRMLRLGFSGFGFWGGEEPYLPERDLGPFEVVAARFRLHRQQQGERKPTASQQAEAHRQFNSKQRTLHLTPKT